MWLPVVKAMLDMMVDSLKCGRSYDDTSFFVVASWYSAGSKCLVH